jgi:signal transduction histidine kinase
VYALVAMALALTAIGPLVQFGGGGPSLTARDLLSAAVSLAAWTPFVLLLLRLLAWQESRSAWIGWASHVLLFVTAPPLHAALVLVAQATLSGLPGVAALRSPGVPGAVLLVMGVFQYGTVAAVLQAMRASRAADRSRLQAAELELARAQLTSQLERARTEALRARLHPHFLFNTLNSISVLAPTDADGAQLMIRRLSDLLRVLLADDAPATIPLQRELDLVEAYLAIQRVRFASRLRTALDVDPAVLRWPVPLFILQPLVENAIRHGIGAREEGGTVTVSAGRTGDRLVLSVADDGPGCATPPDGEGGLGLRATRERLAQLYGDRGRLVLEPGPAGGLTVRVEMPAGAPA